MFMSAVNSVSGTDSTTQSSSTSGLNGLSENDFLSLLTAQLKNQDPESAQDPSQFVNQLVSFSSLEQLISINQNTSATNSSQSGSANTGTNS
jgi:flagellar basal-body rod modification protein FlgD